MLDDIVRRCREGETRAFRELFLLHGGMIQKISFRMTRNPEWQRDIFQEVVQQVIGGIGSFRGECKFTTWLYRITVNAALRFLQKEGIYKNMVPFDETAVPHAASGEGVLDSLERREMFLQIRNTLMTLPAGYRKVLSLFYFADMTIDEITGLTGKSNGAIKAMLWKGRRAMAKKLKKRKDRPAGVLHEM
jgi:RNA polymerase sigma-70 factor (ECF subfamily)